MQGTSKGLRGPEMLSLQSARSWALSCFADNGEEEEVEEEGERKIAKEIRKEHTHLSPHTLSLASLCSRMSQEIVLRILQPPPTPSPYRHDGSWRRAARQRGREDHNARSEDQEPVDDFREW